MFYFSTFGVLLHKCGLISYKDMSYGLITTKRMQDSWTSFSTLTELLDAEEVIIYHPWSVHDHWAENQMIVTFRSMPSGDTILGFFIYVDEFIVALTSLGPVPTNGGDLSFSFPLPDEENYYFKSVLPHWTTCHIGEKTHDAIL